MPRYEIIIYWSQADDAFIAEVPELSGCAADGKTHKEALPNVEIIIQERIETAQELGAPSPPRAPASSSLESQRPHPLENQMPKGAPPAKGGPTLAYDKTARLGHPRGFIGSRGGHPPIFS